MITFGRVMVYLCNVAMAAFVGWQWHQGDHAIAVAWVTFFMLDAIRGLRERVNELAEARQ